MARKIKSKFNKQLKEILKNTEKIELGRGEYHAGMSIPVSFRISFVTGNGQVPYALDIEVENPSLNETYGIPTYRIKRILYSPDGRSYSEEIVKRFYWDLDKAKKFAQEDAFRLAFNLATRSGAYFEETFNDEELARTFDAMHGKLKQRSRLEGLEERNFGSLEVRTGIFIVSIFSGLALSFSSLSLTGNIISNVFGSSQSLLGIFLFVFGIVGLFFVLKRK